MVPFLFCCGLIGYAISASLPFTGLAKGSPTLYYLIGCSVGVLLNAAWLTIARKVPSFEVVTLGVMWDAMITLAFVLTPVVFWNQQVGPRVWIGAGLVLAGMIIAKS